MGLGKLKNRSIDTDGSIKTAQRHLNFHITVGEVQ
jgi:hypothetical protein